MIDVQNISYTFLEFLPKGSNDLFSILHSCQLNMVSFIKNFIYIIHHIAVPIYFYVCLSFLKPLCYDNMIISLLKE